MNTPEFVLLSHLTDTESLDYLVREGFSSEMNRECIPTELLREIVSWTLLYYFKSGRKVAPTKEGIEETWGTEMEKVSLTLDDENEVDSIQWAVDELRGKHAEREINEFIIELARNSSSAAPPDRVGIVKGAAGQLYALSQKLTSHHDEAPADIGLGDAWARYQERSSSRQTITGLTFGMDLVDRHTMGIRGGEIAVFAGGTGSGKSWFGGKTARAEWRRGRRTVVITLENTVDDFYDRFACMVGGIDYELWQRGQVDEGAVQRFHMAYTRFRETEHSPIAIMPEIGDRDPVALVQRAFSLGAESLIVDQVSHVEPVPGSRVHKRNEQVAEIMKTFQALISTGPEKIPLLLMAQIKREGYERARKTGRYVVDDLSESSEIEKSASFVFSVLRNPTEANEDQALFQMLKGRRVSPRDWDATWRLGYGDMRAMKEHVRA